MKPTWEPTEDQIARLSDLILSMGAAIRSSKRKVKSGGRNGGRPAKPSNCPNCGELCPSAAAAKKHCTRGFDCE